MAWRREAAHDPFPLARGLMHVFRSIVEVSVAAMLDTRHDLFLGCRVAPALVGDDHARRLLASLQELGRSLGQEFPCRRLIPLALHEDVQHVAMLINSPPQGVQLAAELEKVLLKMPFITRTCTATM